MSVPIHINKSPKEFIFKTFQVNNSNNYTGSTLSFLNDVENLFFNSIETLGTYYMPSDNDITRHNSLNKRFLKFDNLLSKQYSDLAAYYEDLELSKVKLLTHNVVSFLLNLQLDAFSFELTSEKSIFYTIKKDNYSFYIQQYFENDEDDGFNSTLVIFQGDEKLESVNGDVFMILSEVEKLFSNCNSLNINLTPINELSY